MVNKFNYVVIIMKSKGDPSLTTDWENFGDLETMVEEMVQEELKHELELDSTFFTDNGKIFLA